jgi:hypothetical protein
MLFPKPPAPTADAAASAAAEKEWQSKIQVGNVLLKNLLGSLIVASDTNGGNEPDAKRAKLTNGNAKGDTFHILDPSFSKQGNNTVAEIPGAILSRLTLGGLVNGLAGVPGGVVDTVTCVPLADLQEGEGHETNGKDMVVPTAGGLTVKELILMGSGLHKSISAR